MKRGSKYYFAGCLATLIGASVIRTLDCGDLIEIAASTMIIFIGAIIVNDLWGDED